ncbi:MerR family transcriptional regulator [Staphylococcus hyicus]|uniref:MerR family transcriptional regulator n=1 Tax=Staphylococcus hyicus TaxID=1284 RepID=UPI00208DE6DF|nr:MerR family transcriptional regulator [Staphylococcus hyicus]MCO4329217.1 MerR family transcriptional regulator [Staphylococcus hyicus]MCO4337078.1 MerR family transcriptional regulator [Staphylococcus hyicus]
MTCYSTGELAKLFGISARTLQYYDEKNILKPALTKDNQYREYTENEVQKLKAILLLKKLGFKLSAIAKIVEEQHALKTVKMLLDENVDQLEREIHLKQAQLKEMKAMNKMIHDNSDSPITKLKDIDAVLKSNQDFPFLTYKTIGVATGATLFEWMAHYQSYKRKKVWPSVLGIAGSIVAAAYITQIYYKSVCYMCPNCHHVFKPEFKAWLFASHTPRTRKLTCPKCGFEGYCIEVEDSESA